MVLQIQIVMCITFFLTLKVFGQTDDSCVRGLPQAVINKKAAGVLNHLYKELPNRKALETVTLVDGLQVSVSHYGCAHYGLTFEFMGDTLKTHNGLALLRELAVLLERLAKADPNSDAGLFRKDLDKALSQPSYEPGDVIAIIDGYSYMIVREIIDEDGKRWVQLVYDVAL